MFVISQIVKRRVEADKRQIGTLKALGYKTWEIARSYCTSAVILTSSLGIVYALLGFVILMITYYVGLCFSRRNIDKIVLAESLKNEG